MNEIDRSEEFYEFIDIIRPICAYEKSKRIKCLIENAIEKSKRFSDKRILANLYDLKIRQLYLSKDKLPEILKLHSEMDSLCRKLNYDSGLALVFHLKWYIERLQGNRDGSSEFIKKAIYIIENSTKIDDYTTYFCKYSFAIENWLNHRDFSSIEILEDCVKYFYKNGFFHGLAMGIGILAMIYQQTQDKEKSMELTKAILGRREYLSHIPEEIKSIIHFFIGFSQELNFNLSIAEEHLQEMQRILEPVYKMSVYSGYYLTALSYLTATYALQGKLELAYVQMKEVDELIEEGVATKNLDHFSEEQLKHIFNLTKFYIHSRLQNFQLENLQDLVQIILTNIGKYYSNAIFFSEFLLNAELTKEQLIEIRNLKNSSTKRVGHIINFLIEKATHTTEENLMKTISTLKQRPVEERMTTEEKAFADLLAAQEYYKLRRFSEIYPLLKKYKNHLNSIEVLELRVFMEAFIQIGAFKNGDPLGPALQYVAIRKCRQFGFSRLENKLLNYLDLQHKDVLKTLR